MRIDMVMDLQDAKHASAREAEPLRSTQRARSSRAKKKVRKENHAHGARAALRAERALDARDAARDDESLIVSEELGFIGVLNGAEVDFYDLAALAPEDNLRAISFLSSTRLEEPLVTAALDMHSSGTLAVGTSSGKDRLPTYPPHHVDDDGPGPLLAHKTVEKALMDPAAAVAPTSAVESIRFDPMVRACALSCAPATSSSSNTASALSSARSAAWRPAPAAAARSARSSGAVSCSRAAKTTARCACGGSPSPSSIRAPRRRPARRVAYGWRPLATRERGALSARHHDAMDGRVRGGGRRRRGGASSAGAGADARHLPCVVAHAGRHGDTRGEHARRSTQGRRGAGPLHRPRPHPRRRRGRPPPPAAAREQNSSARAFQADAQPRWLLCGGASGSSLRVRPLGAHERPRRRGGAIPSAAGLYGVPRLQADAAPSGCAACTQLSSAKWRAHYSRPSASTTTSNSSTAPTPPTAAATSYRLSDKALHVLAHAANAGPATTPHASAPWPARLRRRPAPRGGDVKAVHHQRRRARSAAAAAGGGATATAAVSRAGQAHLPPPPPPERSAPRAVDGNQPGCAAPGRRRGQGARLHHRGSTRPRPMQTPSGCARAFGSWRSVRRRPREPRRAP